MRPILSITNRLVFSCCLRGRKVPAFSTVTILVCFLAFPAPHTDPSSNPHALTRCRRSVTTSGHPHLLGYKSSRNPVLVIGLQDDASLGQHHEARGKTCLCHSLSSSRYLGFHLSGSSPPSLFFQMFFLSCFFFSPWSFTCFPAFLNCRLKRSGSAQFRALFS